MIINIISFAAAIAAVFSSYKIWIARAKGKKMSELKVWSYSLIVNVIILWVINIYFAYFK